MFRPEMAKRIAHLKELARQQSQQHLVQAIDHKQQEDHRLQEMLRFQLQQEKMLEQFLEGASPLPAGFWSQWDLYQQRMKEQIHFQRQKVEQAVHRMEEKRQEVISRSVDEKMWFKLNQMILLKQLAEAQRRAQKELDELASHRHAYRS